MSKKVDIDNVNIWSDGKLQLAVGLCKKIGLTNLFNKHLENNAGRPSDIPAGIEAEIMIASIADDGYQPLSGIQDYYRYKDLEGIFHYPIKLSQLNDDRFGNFLDAFYDAGCRKIFTEASSLAFSEYGLTVENINYDTTSKVMWGEYKTTNHLEDDGTETSYISIDFGHSKDKRSDKKQLKIGLGTANGVVADAKVLSGNMDDKTYNKENLDDVEQILTKMNVNRDDFYYIADSALFTKDNVEKANDNNISFITRMPNNTKLAKELLSEPLTEDAKMIEIEKAKKDEVSIYRLIEKQAKYKGNECKFAILYSKQLEETKEKSTHKKVKKERAKIKTTTKKYKNHSFKCRADAEEEIKLLNRKAFSKLKFHNVNFNINENYIYRSGKPSKNRENDIVRTEYQLLVKVELDESKVEDYNQRQCKFILASNDLTISGEKMIREYKTQNDVEKRFKNLKSPQYMNSLFLKNPKRIEAMVYLLLIVLMILTIAEKVVRNDLEKNDDLVYGIDRRKLKKPTLKAILQIIDRIRVITYKINGKTYREIRELDDSCKKIIKSLGLNENHFAWNRDKKCK